MLAARNLTLVDLRSLASNTRVLVSPTCSAPEHAEASKLQSLAPQNSHSNQADISLAGIPTARKIHEAMPAFLAGPKSAPATVCTSWLLLVALYGTYCCHCLPDLNSEKCNSNCWGLQHHKHVWHIGIHTHQCSGKSCAIWRLFQPKTYKTNITAKTCL